MRNALSTVVLLLLVQLTIAKSAAATSPPPAIAAPCSQLEEGQTLRNGWPAQCARITEGFLAEMCSSLQGHPSHSRVGVLVEFEFSVPLTGDIPFAYVGVRDLDISGVWQEVPGIYAGVWRENELRFDDARGAWISPPSWAIPVAGRHAFQIGRQYIEVDFPADLTPETACQATRRVAVPAASSVTGTTNGSGPVVRLDVDRFLRGVEFYESKGADPAAPTLPAASLVGRAALLLAPRLNYRTPQPPPTLLWPVVEGGWLDEGYGRFITLPAEVLEASGGALLCVGGLHCHRASIVKQDDGSDSLYGLDRAFPGVQMDDLAHHPGIALAYHISAEFQIPSLGISTSSYHILRPDGVVCGGTSLCDYNEACPYKITTQCDIPASEDGCASGPAGAQAWGLALVAGAWVWRRRRRRSVGCNAG